jgi:hypothetical protein
MGLDDNDKLKRIGHSANWLMLNCLPDVEWDWMTTTS